METAKYLKLVSFRNTSLIVIFSLSSLLFALGVNGERTDDLLVDPHSIWKTIETDDGEIIDCVDIYKQPALRHPRLKNHTIQMKPSSYPIGLEPKSTFQLGNVSNVKFQRWHRKGESCPEGSIPISRSSEKFFREKKTRRTNSLTPAGYKSEYATAFLPGSKFHGALCDINVWNPNAVEKEMSTAQVWVTDGGGDEIDTIEAGWSVTTYTNHPILFIYYTPDNYRTGCYNVGCPGFVQTNKDITLGAFIDHASTYTGTQFEVAIGVHRDDKNGNWWFNIQGHDVGYWPANIFNGGLRGTASLIEWGGMVVNSNPGGRHTTTGMGSGYFSDEGYGRAAYIKHLRYIADGGNVKDAKHITGYATRPSCYDIHVQKWNNDMGIHFYYGGPGYSPACMH